MHEPSAIKVIRRRVYAGVELSRSRTPEVVVLSGQAGLVRSSFLNLGSELGHEVLLVLDLSLQQPVLALEPRLLISATHASVEGSAQ